MRNLIAIFMLSVIVLACSGCGTVAGHDDWGTMGGVNNGVYRGVRTDWQWAAHPEPEASMFCWLYTLDMPMSLVGDTLYMPIDVVTTVQTPDDK